MKRIALLLCLTFSIAAVSIAQEKKEETKKEECTKTKKNKECKKTKKECDKEKGEKTNQQ